MINEAYFDSLLPLVHKHICAILLQPVKGELARPLPSSHESAYRAMRTIVLIAKRGQWVYDKLRFELKETATRLSKQLVSFRLESRVDWLEELVAAATWFDHNTRLLEGILTYLDRNFVRQKSELQPVR